MTLSIVGTVRVGTSCALTAQFCAKLSSPDNATLSTDLVIYGTVVLSTCNRGFILPATAPSCCPLVTEALFCPMATSVKHWSAWRETTRLYGTTQSNTVNVITHCVSSHTLLWLLLPWELCDVLWWVCLSVCLSVCLFARITRKPHGRTSSVFYACNPTPWLGPPLTALRYVITSGCVDDVMLLHNQVHGSTAA